MGNSFKRIKKMSCYKIPDQLTACTGIWFCDDNGIFFDKKQYSKMFVLSQSQTEDNVSFASSFALLRLESVRYQVRKNYVDSISYLTLYIDALKVKSFIDAEAYFQDIVYKIEQVENEGIEIIPVDCNSRFDIMYRFIHPAAPADGDLPRNYFARDIKKWFRDFQLQLQHIDCCTNKDWFVFHGQYCRIYMITKGSDTMNDCLKAQKGIVYVASEIAGISDESVVRAMKSLYLDAEQVVSRLMKKNPELYDLYINGSKQDSMFYTMAGSLVLFADDIQENLEEHNREFTITAADQGLDIIPVYGEYQRELLKQLYPISMKCIPTRVVRTESAINFCKYI